MRVSSSPWMKQICLLSGISRSLFMMFIWSMVSPASLLTLHWMHAKTQGKKQLKTQQQAGGRNFELDSLQSVERLEYAESATMISHQLLISRLTAPMLLPQPITSYPLAFKKEAATSTSLLYNCPNVINSPQVLFPQPLKSKQASPIPSGTEDRKSVPQKRLEPLPCRQRITYLMFSCLQRVSQKGTLNVSAVNRWPILRDGLSISGLQVNLGGRMSIYASCSMIPSGEQCFISKRAGFMVILVSLGWSLEMLASLRVTFIRICIIIMKLTGKKGVARREGGSAEDFTQAVASQLKNETYWHIFRQKYESDGWPAATSQISEAPIEELHISDNAYPGMVKEIAGIVFPNLITLSLILNAIESLQPLTKMQAPRLQMLQLSRNYLRRVSPLRKANFPHLRLLVWNDNPILDCQVLTECDFKYLQSIIFENWDDSSALLQQESPLFKLQSRKLSFLRLKSSARIRRSVILAHLSSLYHPLQVNLCGN